ncbi:MAG: TRAP transporter large permease subunit [Pseudomonadota bacterium]
MSGTLSPAAPSTPLWHARLCTVFGKVTGAMAALATVWIFVLMFAIVLDVAGLKLFNRPIYGVNEITAQSIVAVVFFQLAHALQTRRLTRADFLIGWIERERPIAAAALNLIFHLAGIVVFSLIAWTVWGDFLEAYAEGEYFGTQGIFTAPMWPVKLMVAVGAAAIALEFLLLALGNLSAFASGERARGLWIVLLLGAVIAGLAALAILDVDRVTVGALIIVALLALIFLGAHISVVLLMLAFLGIWMIRDNPLVAVRALRTAATGTINSFAFGVVPLFVLMGMLVDVADIGKDAYKVAAWMLRKLRGGLGIATVAANAVFAAVTGISIASAAVFSRVAVPQMTENGYSARFAAGTVAGSSVLGMLIPPSLLLIIYGFVSETSVGQLFLAAVLPGILLAVVFGITILALARLKPDFVGETTTATELEPETVGSSILKLLPIAVLVLVVLGGIYTGQFTPTQAGAVGAFAALVVAIALRRLSWASLWRVLKETAQISVTILILIIGASAFTKMLAMSTIPREMVDLITGMGFGFWAFMMAYLVVVILMGMFLDSTSIILIVVPLTIGVVEALGGDIIGPDILIWFGVVTVIAVEIGLLTPPFGITVYVVKAALEDIEVSLTEVFIGVLPFVVAMLIVTLLIIFIPWLSIVWFA